jgi:DNA adenine methylase
MKSIFRYPGAKSALRAEILSLAPHYAEYREPFLGGGSILFGVPRGKRRWVNDKDAALMAVYRALQGDPAAFIRACRRIKPLERGERPGRLRALFEQLVRDETADPALRFFFLNRTAFGGRVNYDLPTRLCCANPPGWDIVATDRLWQAAGLLWGVRLTAGDYLPLLRAPGEGVWVYCDPPYVRNNRLPRRDRLYRHVLTPDEHAELAGQVRACGHHVLVSYDDDPFVRRLYAGSGFRVRPVRVCYRLGDGRGRAKVELLISNYDPPSPPRRRGTFVTPGYNRG